MRALPIDWKKEQLRRDAAETARQIQMACEALADLDIRISDLAAHTPFWHPPWCSSPVPCAPAPHTLPRCRELDSLLPHAAALKTEIRRLRGQPVPADHGPEPLLYTPSRPRSIIMKNWLSPLPSSRPQPPALLSLS